MAHTTAELERRREKMKVVFEQEDWFDGEFSDTYDYSSIETDNSNCR